VSGYDRPCRYCGSYRTNKAVYVRGKGDATVVRIACENAAACKARVAKGASK